MQKEKTDSLSPEQFYTALKKGQGRAYWHIDPSNHEQYRDLLFKLCTHTAAYDPYNEEDRSPWLFKLLERTGALDSYRDEIIKALYSAENLYDKRQLLRLVGEFAKRDATAFQAFYNNAPRLIPNMPQESLAATLIGFALRDGLFDAAETIGESFTTQSKHGIDANSWDIIHACIDTDSFIPTVLEWVAACPNADVDLCEMPENTPSHKISVPHLMEPRWDRNFIEDNISIRNNPLPATQKVNELFEIAHSELGNDPAPYAIWAETEASEQDLHAVFERLLQEDQPELQLRFLWVFQNKPMPRLEFRILCLALSENVELVKAAAQALSNLHAPEVRDLAFRLLKIFPNALHHGAISLFFKNYKSEDAACIERVISIPQDVDLCQALCEQILTLCHKHADQPELTNLLLWAYENTPSSATRFDIVQLLIALKAAPRSLLEEACHDCDSMTRLVAADALA